MDVSVSKESLPTFLAGNGTVGTDSIRLSTIGYPVFKHVVVRAADGNTGTIEVAPHEDGEGFLIAENEQTPPIYIDDVSKVWIKGSEADQDYNWVAN